MRIQKLTLTFENLESVTIPGKYIGYFSLFEIEKCISRVAVNAIMPMEIVHNFHLELHSDARDIDTLFCGSDPGGKCFDRILAHQDIAHIDIVVDEGYTNDKSDEPIGKETEYNYIVHWEGESDYVNAAQKSYLSKPGNLYITIGDMNPFHIMDIDNPETTNRRFCMYGINTNQ